MKKIICIDAGHGGKDGGGGTNKHFKEKDMVLKISKEQQKHFTRNGIKVVMTRTSDEYLDSVPRTTRVKASGASYCISNHINAGGGEGAETIHSVFSNKTLADGILRALVAKGAKYRRAFSRKNNSGGDYYYMHRLTGNVTTIIVEYGFADNANDTKKILSDWKIYAEAVARYYIENVFKQKYIAEGGKKEEPKKEEPKKPSNSKPVLKKGSKGEAVKELQRILNSKGNYKLAIDGSFGDLTDKAVRDFQKKNNLAVDGSVGSATWAKLLEKAPAKPAPSKMYRVRKTWADAKSQKGAYKDLSNAKKEADKHSGYKVFDENGKVVYTPTVTHTVKKGDTLWSLSKKYNVSIATIKKNNNLKSDTIVVGQKLKIK